MESAFGSFRTRILLTLMVLALCVGAFAQGTGELTGLITDQTGAVVAGVQVKLSNTATGETHTTTTTAAGIYTFPALPVTGSYTLQLSAKGFKSVKVQDIIVTVGGITSRDVKVEVGAQTETLTVEAGVQQVQTQESDLSQLVDRRVWQDMPLETRDSNQFINLFAGTVQGNVALNTVNGGTDRGAAVNGTRSGTGNFMVEGFDNNDQGLGGGGSIGAMTGGANTTISPDAIEEFRVIEHNFSAEYGKAGGFVTDTVLKSGTNQWHGSLFEYNRIQALAANSYFSNMGGSKDALVRNQFGGSIGGPIVKDRTFFYFTTEFERLRDKNPLTADTLTPDYLNFWNSGNFQAFQEGTGVYATAGGFCNTFLGGPCAAGTFSNEATVGPIATTLTTAQPTPLCVPGAANCIIFPNLGPSPKCGSYCGADGGGLYTGAIIYPVAWYGQLTLPQADSFDHARYSAKIDHKLGTNDSLTGTYLYDNGDDLLQYAGGPGTFGPASPNHARAQNAGVTWSHTFSPTILNQARMSYTRHTANFPGNPQGNSGTPTIFTAFDVTGNGWGNNPNLPQFFTENRFEYRDDLSITKGKHQFKAGAVYGRTRNGSRFEADFGGEFAAYGINDVLSDFKFGHDSDYALYGGLAYGSWYYAQQTINPTVTPAVRPNYYRGFRANEYAAYFQDDFRAASRLTFNLGIRWDYFGPPHNFQSGIDSNYYPGSNVEPTCTVKDPAKGSTKTATGPCNIQNQFYPVGNPTMQAFANGGLAVRNHEIWNKDTNNFAPRIGFSWDVTGRQKLVLRGGFGIAYDRMYNNIFENLRFNPPFFCFCATGAIRNGVPGDSIDTPGLYTLPYTTTNVGLFNNASLFPVLPKTSPRAIDPNLVTAYYEQTSFGFQYEISKDLVWETDYVGTFGHKLIGIVNLNTFPGRTAGSINPDNPFAADGATNSTKRPNTNVSNINLRTNAFGSNYHALQTSLRKRFARGLSFNANYTYAKSLDEISDTFTPRQGNPAGVTINPTDSFNPKLDYGPSDFDVKHRVVASFSYELPFMKTNRWIGGWSLSGIVSGQSGVPFSVFDSQVDTNKNGTFNDRSAYIGPGSQTNAYVHDRSPAHGFLNPGPTGSPYFADVTCPASVNSGLWCEGPSVGQLNRGAFFGPKFVNTDISAAKKFKITESSSLSFQANFFDLFNHPNFAIPVQDTFNAQFGSSTQTFKNTDSGGVRVTQLALRFDF